MYKYKIYDRNGNPADHCDPYGFGMELRPNSASIVRDMSQYHFKDSEWMQNRSDCRQKQHMFDRSRTLYEYAAAAPSIYRFKYKGRQEYAEFFGEEMGKYLGDFIRSVSPDVLVPVPLHKKKLSKRGYNQAACLARALGKNMQLPVDEKLVKRVRNTAPMKRLNPAERQNNLKKAFNIGRNDVKLYDRIILVDDIYTTGTTLDEIAALLKSHGVSEVYCVTLACGAGL